MSHTTEHAKDSPSPTGDEHFDLLMLKGDALEKVICEDFGSLQTVLLPYSRVWAKHIYPRRIGNGSHLEQLWQLFGGRHYTTLIRVHHALKAKDAIVRTCQNIPDNSTDYKLVLEVQAACTGLWDNLGAAIDNFVNSWVEAGRVLGIDIAKENRPVGDDKNKDLPYISTGSYLLNEHPKLYYAFQRRHQYIHSTLVPKALDEGMIILNLEHYKAVDTIWAKDREDFNCIDSRVEADWEEIMQELGCFWERLFAWLEKHDTDIQQSNTSPPNITSNSTESSRVSGFSLELRTSTVSEIYIPIYPSGVSGIN